LSAFDLPVPFEVELGLPPPEREHFANRRDHGVDRRLQFARKSFRLARPHPTTGVEGGQEDWSGDTQPAYPTDAIAAPHQVSQPDRRAYEVCTIVRWSQVVKLRGPCGGAVVIASHIAARGPVARGRSSAFTASGVSVPHDVATWGAALPRTDPGSSTAAPCPGAAKGDAR